MSGADKQVRIGGKRAGAGRPPSPHNTVSARLPAPQLQRLDELRTRRGYTVAEVLIAGMDAIEARNE